MSLDPRINRLEREAKKEAARKKKIPPLNPPFPYYALPIPLEAFRLMDPPRIDTDEDT